MKFKDFRKIIQKSIFTTVEARLVCLKDNPKTLNLQLYQWVKALDLISVKRGLYMFADAKIDAAEIAKNLYCPCYFSLEYALSKYGVIPEATFEYTLVTPKATRRFETPAGVFVYRTIKREAFCGFDSESLMADKEKALVDWFYLNTHKLEAKNSFWQESRLEAIATELNFKKIFRYAKLFKSNKLDSLLNSFYLYAKSQQISQ